MSSTYGKTWDGKSRPVDDTYRQNYDDIFGPKKEKVKEQDTDPEQDMSSDGRTGEQRLRDYRAHIGNHAGTDSRLSTDS
jgi:hypothetical protein